MKLKNISVMAIPGMVRQLSEMTATKAFAAIELATGVTRIELESNTRVRHVADTRHIFNYLMRYNTELSLAAIGSYTNRDHATVLNSIKVVTQLLDTDKNFIELYDKIESTATSNIQLYHVKSAAISTVGSSYTPSRVQELIQNL